MADSVCTEKETAKRSALGSWGWRGVVTRATRGATTGPLMARQERKQGQRWRPDGMMTILMMVVMAVLAAARSMVDGIDDHDTERSVSCQRRGAALGGGGEGGNFFGCGIV